MQGELKRYFRRTSSTVALYLQVELCRLLRRANCVDIFVDNFAVFAGRYFVDILSCVCRANFVCPSDFVSEHLLFGYVSFLSIDYSFLSELLLIK